MNGKLKTIALAVASVALVAAYALLLWEGPWWIDGNHLRTKNLQPADGVVITGVRTTLVALGAGVVAALGLYYTHRGHRHAEKLYKHSQDQFAYAREKDQELAQLTREGQVTEQYVEAIKLLSTPEGDDGMMARLGGIYSLERIMRDSEKDHDTAVHVLAAFVRKYAPAPDPELPVPDERDVPMPAPKDDVQAALTVLMRRPTREEKQSLDLSFTDLRRADLAGGYLRGANLIGAALDRADLSNSVLAYACLSGADFTGASLTNADLRAADLVGDRIAAQISVEQLLETEFDASTKLPLHLTNHPQVKVDPVKNIRVFSRDRARSKRQDR
ncbi:pentapeptide repeat-containing protein [Streptomyces europaeiscabiei]|uniref:pentapeptide repeat-containing protein n=1 Tax=Streptomyces europaeiscabiei TaxID=146819 RepID=UPI002E275464|nr:pentapeptide repeat-containing protein [Streptomyces europaeiscabiei]